MMNNARTIRRVAVIGGGITGLAAAHRLIELAKECGCRLDVTLYEASERLGGVLKTQHVDGYTVETGADSFITSKPWAVNLCDRLGLRDRLVSTDARYRRSFILLNGRPTPTPDGFELLVPRSLKSLLASPFLSFGAKERVSAEAYVQPRADRSDESLADFVRRRFGREVLDRIIQPLVGGIYTSDPERLSMQATLPRFVEMERRHGSLLRAVWTDRINPEAAPLETGVSGARYGLFVSLTGGLSELIEALESHLRPEIHVRLSTRVADLAYFADGGYSIRTDRSERETFEMVVCAVAARQAAELISPWDDDLAVKLRAIESASSAIVVTGHRLADIRHRLDAFGLVVPHKERRRILAVSFLSRKFANRAPQGHVQLRTFVGGAMQPELLEQDDDRLIAMVRDELRELLGVEGEPTMALVNRYVRGMPQYHVGHLDRVAAIESAAARHPRLALAGNAYYGVGIPDCIHSGEQAAVRVMKQLSADDGVTR